MFAFSIKSVVCFLKILSHALKITANQRPVKDVTYSVVFHPAFPSLLASDYRNGAKNVCIRYEMAPKFLVNVVGFKHKIKIFLQLWQLKNKIFSRRNGSIYNRFNGFSSHCKYRTTSHPL